MIKSRLLTIGAILRKDLTSLWPLAAATALSMGVGPFVATTKVDHLPGAVAFAIHAMPFLMIFLSMVTAFAVSHQDPAPGMRQDWLTRPVRRLDLILSKVAFLVAVVVAPLVVAFIYEIVKDDVPLSIVLGTLLDFMPILIAPFAVVALASLTSTMVEAVVSLVVSIILAIVLAAYGSTRHENTMIVTFDWVAASLVWLFFAGLTVLVLWLQYVRRLTLVSRIVTPAAILMFFYTMVHVPAAFGQAVRETFGAHDPRTAKPQLIVDGLCDAPVPNDLRAVAFAQPNSEQITATIRMEGVPDQLKIAGERAGLRLTGPDTNEPFQPYVYNAHSYLQDTDRPGTSRMAGRYTATLRKETLKKGAGMDLNLRFNLKEPVRTVTVPVDAKPHFVKGFGWCGAVKPRKFDHGAAYVFTCTATGVKPALLEAAGTSKLYGETIPWPLDCEGGCSLDTRPAAYRIGTKTYRWKVMDPKDRPTQIVLTALAYRGEVHRTASFTNAQLLAPRQACGPIPGFPKSAETVTLAGPPPPGMTVHYGKPQPARRRSPSQG